MLSSIRRKSQVFVEIPPSPLHKNQVLPPSRSRVSVDVLSNKGGANVQKQSTLDLFISSTKKRKLDVTLDNDVERGENTPIRANAKRAKTGEKEKSGTVLPKLGKITKAGVSDERIVKPKIPVKRPKKLVEPVWEEITDIGTREEVEDRIHLREFVIRFAPLLRLARMHVEALDEFDTLTDQTTKALLKSLLDLIAADEVGRKKEILSKTVRELGSSNSPAKLWDLLSRLRTSLQLPIPDPTPSEGERHSTRTRVAQAVSRSIQLVPVLVALADIALRGPSIRAELELGTKELPAENRRHAAAIKEEMDRWGEVRKMMAEEKAKVKDSPEALKALRSKHAPEEKKHKSIMRDIYLNHAQTLHSLRSRFFPLGTDFDGRVYYALSRPPNTHKVPTPHERKMFRRWAWFLFVWGKRPAREEKKAGKKKATDESEDDDEDEEKWWGFHDTSEIRKLAKWLEKTVEEKSEDNSKGEDKPRPSNGTESLILLSDDGMNGATEDDDSGIPASNLKGLLKGLLEFADFLDAKVPVPEEKGKSAPKEKETGVTGKEKAGTMGVKKFYG